MTEVNHMVVRVDNSVTNAFDLEGVDSTLFGTFVSGTAEKLTFGASAATFTDVNASGGEAKAVDITTIHDDTDKEQPGSKTALSYSFGSLWDPADPALVELKKVLPKIAAVGLPAAMPGLFQQGQCDVMYTNTQTVATLKGKGVDYKKVNFVEAAFPQHGDLLRGGSLDAVVSADPFMSRILETGMGYVASYYSTFLPDGQPIVWASRILGSRLRFRLTGSDLFADLWPRLTARATPVFVLAPSAAVARGLEESNPAAATLVAPMLDVGSRSELVDLAAQCVAEITAVAAKVVILSLGHPKDVMIADESAVQATPPCWNC